MCLPAELTARPRKKSLIESSVTSYGKLPRKAVYGGLRGKRDISILGSRADRGAVGKMERSMGGARKLSSSECQEVETEEKIKKKTKQQQLSEYWGILGDCVGQSDDYEVILCSPSPSRSSVSSAQLVDLFE